jgi:DNA (cytosine-5)-methyltransferase 1
MKVGTFFSGVGSPEQALNNLVKAGAEIDNKPLEIEIEFACEIDKYAKQTYLKNFKPKLFATDITTLDMTDLPYVDLLVFGFPCQAFSMAGKRQGFEDTRGTLFYDALRYLKEHRPRYFIAENVKGLLSHDNNKTFQTIIDCLAKTTNYQMSLMPFDNLDYHIHYKVLNTKHFGLPQNRERIFIIGIRDDEDNNFNFPKEIPLELKLKDVLQDNLDYFKLIDGFNSYDKIKYVDNEIVGTLTEHQSRSGITNGFKIETNFSNKVDKKYYLSEENIEKLKEYNKRNKEKGNGFSAKFHNPENEVMSALKIGGAGADDLIEVDEKYYLSEEQQKRLLDRTDVDIENVDEPTCFDVYNKKLVKDTSICLTEPHHNNLRLVPETKDKNIRRLTPIECERLQGFPDNFTEGVSDTQRYKQMGNTITVNVIELIIKNLIK